MKIGYLSDSYIPSKRANSVHVMKMCAAFKKNGLDVVLYANRGEDLQEKGVKDIYGVNEEFEIKIVDNNLPGKLKSILLAASKVSKMLEDNVDVIYGRSLLSLFFCRENKPFIYEVHVKQSRYIFKILEKRLLRRKNLVKIVAISQNLKMEFLNTYSFLKEEDVIVLHDGADRVCNYDSNVEMPFELQVKNSPIIGYIGHLYPGKCMEVLIEIAKKMKHRDFHVIGGNDEWVSYWKDKCNQVNIENIIFYGYIDNCYVNNYYNLIDVVVLPFSNNIYYNKDKKDNIGKWISPLKLFEAMANAKAMIVSSISSIQEVVTDNVNAMLVDPDNIDGWCNKIDELCNNAKLREILGNNAKYLLETEYTWDIRSKRIIEIFGQCINKN